MHLQRIVIKNIKCFSHIEIDFSDRKKDVRQWTTLFGKNGLGKSTLLQAIGATLAGPSAMRELLPVAEGWVRREAGYGEIEAHLLWTGGDTQIPGWPKKKAAYVARYIVTSGDPDTLPKSLAEQYYTVPTLALIPWSGEGTSKERENVTKDMRRLQQTAYAEDKPGWLGCGYGPFRRLSGGAQAADRILYAERKSARFVTLFREDAALTNATEWLIKLYNTSRDGDESSKSALDHVRTAFASKLFPDETELAVTAESALLRVGGGRPIPLHDLSDGYRSMLALGIDLLRWLIKAFPEAPNPMDCPGVVLIDELDAHLHPDWQRQIGHWLRNKFPQIQFIVATHSPFLAQVTDNDKPESEISGSFENGLGGNIVLEDTAIGVQARSDTESVRDYRVDQILQSPLFNLDSLYSPRTEQDLSRHQQLSQKERAGPLSPAEQEEYQQLSFWRESLPILTDPRERRLEQTLNRIIREEQRHR